MLKNITMSADENLIRSARDKAQREFTTLNSQFRRWLEAYANTELKASNYDQLMDALRYVRSGKHCTRDEMNER